MAVVHERQMYFSVMNMKTLMSGTVIALALVLTGCANGDGSVEQIAPVAGDNLTFYGEVIDTIGGLNGEALKTALSLFEGRTQVRFEGEITATCPKKGCWMNVASGRDTVFVRFQDYGFFVPTEGVEGKRTIVEGEAFYDTLSVADLRHYAQDAGATEEEIAAITEPELELAFMATGVMIED
ncbi:MAG: DUF4920 domain-containing protein [Flavobacteriales bacterium]|nr:DUF4920 domain-containing protein [Flavobacteriales bacterium]